MLLWPRGTNFMSVVYIEIRLQSNEDETAYSACRQFWSVKCNYGFGHEEGDTLLPVFVERLHLCMVVMYIFSAIFPWFFPVFRYFFSFSHDFFSVFPWVGFKFFFVFSWFFLHYFTILFCFFHGLHYITRHMCNLCVNTRGGFRLQAQKPNYTSLFKTGGTHYRQFHLHCTAVWSLQYITITKFVPCCQRCLHYTFPLLALFGVAVLKNKKLQQLTFWKPLVLRREY